MRPSSMRYAKGLLGSVVLGALLAAVVVGPVAAGYPGTFLIKVEASGFDGFTTYTGSWEEPLPIIGTDPFSWNPIYNPPGPPFEIYDSTHTVVLAHVDQFNVYTKVGTPGGQSQLKSNFTLTNNNEFEVTYKITSTIVGFTPKINPGGNVNGSMTLTDAWGDGANLVGLQPGGKIFKAWTDAGLFTYFTDGVQVQYPTSSKNTPPPTTTGLIPIIGSVSTMQSEYYFKIGFKDQVSSNLTFTVVPEPSSIIAVASGVVGMFGIAFRKKS